MEPNQKKIRGKKQAADFGKAWFHITKIKFHHRIGYNCKKIA